MIAHTYIHTNTCSTFNMPSSARVFHKIKSLTQIIPDAAYIVNRNPRNLEKLRIAQKPVGYHLDRPGRSYWHQLNVNVSNRYVTAEVKHFENGIVVSASTSEWAIKKQLYKTNDTSAYVNLGRVLAFRCLCSGITEMSCNVEAVPNSKLSQLLEQIKQNGVALEEAPQYKKPAPWDMDRPEPPTAIEGETATLRKI